eukprot:6466822-Amphidinium_carterae.1
MKKALVFLIMWAAIAMGASVTTARSVLMMHLAAHAVTFAVAPLIYFAILVAKVLDGALDGHN